MTEIVDRVVIEVHRNPGLLSIIIKIGDTKIHVVAKEIVVDTYSEAWVIRG